MSDQEVRDKKLRQIQALLDKADSTPFSDEADACRAKAEELMLSYQISEFEANQRKDKGKVEVPVLKHYPVDVTGVVRESIFTLGCSVARHIGGRPIMYGWRDKSGGSIGVVAYPSDHPLFDMLFTSLRLQMSNEMEPKPDPTLTEAENIALLKEAGLKWERIYALMRPGEPWQRSACVRWGAMYTEYCAETNRERNYTSPTVYQRNFAEGFVRKIDDRFAEIRAHQIVQDREQGGTGMEVMIRDKNKIVNEEFAALFPKTVPAKMKGGKFDMSARVRGANAGERADLGQQRVSTRKEIG